MGKRQTRILSKDLVEQFPALEGLEANVLLKDKTVLHGFILHINQQTLILKDLRLKKHIVLLNNIEEIILDKETLF